MEDYSKARTLYRISLHGEDFRIVRRRFNGKPWRKYLALIHNNQDVAGNTHTTDLDEAITMWKRRLEIIAPTQEALLAALDKFHSRDNPT